MTKKADKRRPIWRRCDKCQAVIPARMVCRVCGHPWVRVARLYVDIPSDASST